MDNGFTASINILPLTITVDTKAQAAADFLPLRHRVIGMFQCANLEYIRVIPTLSQRRV
jgi:hypothetical protein